MSSEVKKILDRHTKMVGERMRWGQHWQDLAEIMLPRRATFTTEGQPGDKRTEEIYDSVPMLARRGLSSALGGLLRPKTTRWIKFDRGEGDLRDNDEVKAWTEDTENRLFRAIYAPEARFIKATREVDDDVITFGADG